MRSRHLVYAIILLQATLLSCATAAPLTVIEDTGEAEPLAPYLSVFGARDETPGNVTPTPSSGAADSSLQFPIHTPELSPGPVARRALRTPTTAPLFIVGCDPLSRQWLAEHRLQLKSLGATGLLVEVPNESSFRALIALADGLPLLPAAGSDLAAALGLTHYPVLITKGHLEQ